jgi:hypothetical protein
LPAALIAQPLLQVLGSSTPAGGGGEVYHTRPGYSTAGVQPLNRLSCAGWQQAAPLRKGSAAPAQGGLLSLLLPLARRGRAACLLACLLAWVRVYVSAQELAWQTERVPVIASTTSRPSTDCMTRCKAATWCFGAWLS